MIHRWLALQSWMQELGLEKLGLERAGLERAGLERAGLKKLSLENCRRREDDLITIDRALEIG
ncbi:hypothetical protein [Leptolyngbya ohadii]|uniref:hypothetical protein n=1 Tax=Leptolyngbya ohadii TaxID=1962290 RepID=UPI00117B8655|nr:hypothetical protein [Leptolyngbya ohadii]